MKNRHIRWAVYLFLLIIAVRYLACLHAFAVQCDGWVIGDWLINFSAGFVRRGLGGWLILHLAGWVGIKPNMVVSIIQSSLILACLFMFFLLIRRKKLNFYYLVLLFSPATLLFPMLDSTACGRKEVILFFLFLLYLHVLKNDLLQNNLITGLLALAIMTATFFHELFFFYTPYFVFAAWLHARREQKPPPTTRSLLLVCASALAMLPLSLFGRYIHGNLIAIDLIQRGLDSHIYFGILKWPDNFGVQNVYNCVLTHGYLPTYSLDLLLSLPPIWFFLRKFMPPHTLANRLPVALAALFLFSSPLFVLAIDWGRWINIHCVLLLFTATLLLDETEASDPHGWLEKRMELPQLWRGTSPQAKWLHHVALALLFLVYVTCWHIPVCFPVVAPE